MEPITTNHDAIFEQAASTYSKPFSLAIQFALAFEGYESDAPSDPGGYTRWGISSVSNPDTNIAEMSFWEAITIHHDRYWQPLHLPPNTHQIIANYLLSASILFGQSQATRCRQRALNYMPQEPRLLPDGVPGPLTQARSKLIIDHHPLCFFLLFLIECNQHATLVVRQRPNLSCYIRGWLHRFEPPNFTTQMLEDLKP